MVHTLETILGENGKRIVLYHVENQYALAVDEIIRKPRKFADALDNIFGVGARVIEMKILRNIYEDFGLSYKEDKSFDFAHYLGEALAQRKKKSLATSTTQSSEMRS